MLFKTIKASLWILFLILSHFSYAQNVNTLDPKSLSETEIKKIEETIENAGLSFEEAAELAKRRGASNQQIKEMQNRLQVVKSEDETSEKEMEEKQKELFPSTGNLTLSEREVPLNKETQVFGAYLFNNENLTFDPGLNTQTPGNYEIGIGDQIIINIWGNSQNNYQLTVNTNGQILLPDVGPVYLAGLPFEAAEKKIKQRLSQIYADMKSPSPQTFAQVNMGRLRSIKINMVGEITAPGTYNLPATATVFNALYLSGGPNKIGSFRNIRIIRNNKNLRTIDIYKFLVDADISENISLKNDDIIFVPPANKQVSVSGQFKRSGLFEMKENESLENLITFAGGFTEKAYRSNVKIYRTTLEGLHIMDVPLRESNNTLLLDGDSVTAGEINNFYNNRVTISGAVFRPGEYEWKENMTLMDLILKADSLKGDAFVNRAVITRLNNDSTTQTIAFDLKPIVRGRQVIKLHPEDNVLIKSHFDLKQNRYINITGEVLNPGQFPYSENTTLADAIFMAGGFTEAADSSFIEVARRLTYGEAAQLSDEMVHVYSFDLSRDLKLNPGDATFTLLPFDQISVRRAPGFRDNASALVTGEVKYAGKYAIQNKNQRISDLITMAGGTTPQSFLRGATFSRKTEELGNEFLAIDLHKIMENPGGEEDLLLRDGDILNVPEYIQTVKITGNVQNPFSVTYKKGKSLKFYINKCGGFSSDALKRKVYVLYPNGSTAITKSFILKSYPEILPGSQIIVPEKPEREGIETSTWLAMASTFSSIALAIAAIIR